MTDFRSIDQIDLRRAALRLDANELAELAGISIRTLRRMRTDPDATRAGNYRKLDEALDAEELRLLAHLIGLHPEKAAEILSAPRSGTGAPDLGGEVAGRGGREGNGREGVSVASPAGN